jgi:hypothetical protein
MPVVSQGQITIVDFNDAVALTSYINGNQALTQVYNPDNMTYTPSYASSNLVLTPSLFSSINGSADIIASAQVKGIKWFDGATEITASDGNYTIAAWAAGSNRPLTIKANLLNGATQAKTYTCEITYQDPNTAATLIAKCNITINRINNGGGVTIAQVTTPNGNVFKNGAGSNLTAKADLLRATGTDTTGNTYKWQKLIGSTWTDLSAGNANGITGFATDTLTIPASGVTGVQMFKCIITDSDATSPTNGQTFSATCTIIDQTDPIQVVVTSSNGDVLKNGAGSTTLTAKLYQAGQEIDAAGSKYTYTWTKVDKDGNPDANFGGAGVATKTGKTLTVGDADVNQKATFFVSVS